MGRGGRAARGHSETPRIGVAGARLPAEALAQVGRPGRSETGRILLPKAPSGGGWPQKAQRVEGGAGIGVAPIGAADAIGGASRGEGCKPRPRTLAGPTASPAEPPRFEPCPKGSSQKIRGVYRRHARLRSRIKPLAPLVASSASRVRSAPGRWPQKAQRVESVAEVGVAPIGAAHAIGESARRGRLRTEATALSRGLIRFGLRKHRGSM